MTSGYFDDLAERLRAAGLPAGEVARTIDDLTAGGVPEEELGTVEDLAERLTGSSAVDGAPGPETDPTAEIRTWTADAFHDRAHLDAFGEAGWEVERIEEPGRFVARRDLGDPGHWEYRREAVRPDAGPPSPRCRWEPCGTWLCYRYYKRARPAAPADDALPEIPPGRPFWSRHAPVIIAAYVAALATIGIGWTAHGGRGAGFLGGFLLGAVLAGGALVLIRTRRS